MKKVLGLLLVSSSIFSMQLDTINSNSLKAQKIQHGLMKLHCPKANKVKQFVKSSSNSAKQRVESIFSPQGLGKVELFHNEEGFHVLHNNETSYVQPCFLNEELRNITTKQLKVLQKIGYFAINKRGKGDFSLDFNERTRGGGPIFGAFMYWVTKSFCYGTIIAATGTVAVVGGTAVVGAASGAAAGGAIGGGAVAGGAAVGGGAAAGSTVTVTVSAGVMSHLVADAAATTLLGVAAGTTVSTVTSAAVGTGISAAGTAAVATSCAGAVVKGAHYASLAIEGAGYAEEAGLLTGAALATGASAAAIIGGIEWLSIHVGILCGMAPTV